MFVYVNLHICGSFPYSPRKTPRCEWYLSEYTKLFCKSKHLHTMIWNNYSINIFKHNVKHFNLRFIYFFNPENKFMFSNNFIFDLTARAKL